MSPPAAPAARSHRRPRHVRPVHAVTRIVAAAALAVDAYYHAHLAPQYDGVSASISQGDLFRIEAALAALAALLVLVWRRLPADVYAWLVAAGGLALLLIYRYMDVGKLGPIPNMYEPSWYTEKWITAVAQAVAVVAMTALILARVWARARRSRTTFEDEPRVL
ncbi:hypothetical protein ACFVT5_11070 [Streptomyces sp. NPDC058001]|uniref:hypothetical protein n=1 Tax=Streptomyces sp. NPDC058001 TaxID=3346300 RepID=UPI0036F01F6A